MKNGASGSSWLRHARTGIFGKIHYGLVVFSLPVLWGWFVTHRDAVGSQTYVVIRPTIGVMDKPRARATPVDGTREREVVGPVVEDGLNAWPTTRRLCMSITAAKRSHPSRAYSYLMSAHYRRSEIPAEN